MTTPAPEYVDKDLLQKAIDYWRNILHAEKTDLDEVDELLSDIISGNEFTYDHEITISLPYAEAWETSVKEYLEITNECIDYLELKDDTYCVTSKARYFRIRGANSLSSEWIMLHDYQVKHQELSTIYKYNNTIYEVHLESYYTPYGMALAKSNLYDKHFPPVYDDDWFIRIECPPNATDNLVNTVLNAYIYELSTSAQLDIEIAPRQTAMEELSEDTSIISDKRLRILSTDDGLADLYFLYRQAISSVDIEFTILSYTKVIEFVSRTAIRIHSNEAIRMKLLTPDSLDPSADFILDLERLVESNKVLSKDRESIIYTVATCCPPCLEQIGSIAPKFLKKFKEQASGDATAKKNALEAFGRAVYATRSAFAHAKANYKRSGDECPASELSEFAECLKIAAQQCIRWFIAQSPSSRIVNEQK